MATLSSFFGSSGGGGAAGVASTFRVFYETGSMTVPSCAVFAAYGVMGGGGVCPRQTVNCFVCIRGGGGGGFSWKEATQTCASDFTVCAIVGAAGEVCGGTSCYTVKNQGGASCITGFSGGTICATGGSCYVPGAGSGGDINTCGGCGAGGRCHSMGGSGAGGLYGNGGSACSGRGGGGFGSGGGAGASQYSGYEDVQCAECSGLWCRIFPSQGGGGGQAGNKFNGGSGLSGRGGVGQILFSHRDCCHTSMGSAVYPPEGGMIPQYTMCGYSQAKTFLSASGGGGGGFCLCHCVNPMADTVPGGQQGAPGGGGGWHGGGTVAGAPNGGFGAGAGSVACSTSECGLKGKGGIGAGANVQFTGADACSGEAGQGIAVVEYWVTTS